MSQRQNIRKRGEIICLRPNSRQFCHRRVWRGPVRRNQPVLNQPVVTDGHEGVPIAAVMVEADLGEHGEVGRDACMLRRQFEEADIRQVVPHDPDVLRRDTAEEFDDRRPASHRLLAPQLEFAVLTEALSQLVEPRRVARPVVAGEAVPNSLARRQLPELHPSYARSARKRYDPTVVRRSSTPSSCIITQTATTPSAPARGSPSMRNGPTLPRAMN